MPQVEVYNTEYLAWQNFASFVGQPYWLLFRRWMILTKGITVAQNTKLIDIIAKELVETNGYKRQQVIYGNLAGIAAVTEPNEDEVRYIVISEDIEYSIGEPVFVFSRGNQDVATMGLDARPNISAGQVYYVREGDTSQRQIRLSLSSSGDDYIEPIAFNSAYPTYILSSGAYDSPNQQFLSAEAVCTVVAGGLSSGLQYDTAVLLQDCDGWGVRRVTSISEDGSIYVATTDLMSLGFFPVFFTVGANSSLPSAKIGEESFTITPKSILYAKSLNSTTLSIHKEMSDETKITFDAPTSNIGNNLFIHNAQGMWIKSTRESNDDAELPIVISPNRARQFLHQAGFS